MEDKENTFKAVPNVSANVTHNADDDLKSAGSDGEMDSYVCKICDLNLSSSDALNNHLHSLHVIRRSKDSFSCGCHTCSEIFLTSSLLIDHLRREHTEHRSQSCSRCEKKLNCSYSIPTHCNSDPPSKIYCMLCITELQNTKEKVVKFMKVKNDKQNTLKSVPSASLEIFSTNNRNADQSIIAGSEGEADSYMCQICQLDFSSSNTLDNHFQSLHIVLCCRSCREEFKTLKMLMNHLRHTHTMIKIKFCSQCGQKLASSRCVPINCDSNELPKIYCGHCMTERLDNNSHAAEVLSEKHIEENLSESISDSSTNVISFNDGANEFNNVSSGEETDSYFCQVCQQDLSSSSDALNKHLRASHVVDNGGGCFSCGSCKKVFQSNYATVNHLRRHHTLQKVHSCSQCGKKLTICHSVPNRDRRKKPLQICCSVCITERKKAKKKSVKVSKAKNCIQDGDILVGESTENQSESVDIVLEITDDELNVRLKEEGDRLASLKQHKPPTKRKKYVCDICSRKFWTEAALLDHQRNPCSKNPYPCEVCDKTFSARHVLKKHLMTHSAEKPYLCETCGKGYRQPSSLRYHQRLHTGERSYGCETCGKKFRDKKTLKDHRLLHTGERPYVCETCGKGFRIKNVLKKHQLYHSGVKNFACDICGRRFFRQDYMRQHRRLHTEENPFGCRICGKKFTNSSSLGLHRRRHEGKMFTCDICPKACWNRAALCNHKLTHTGVRPYSCDICGKEFRQWVACRIHARTHSGEKPYVCNACGRAFAQQSHLKRHLRVHTGEKPFECDICGRSFAEKRNMFAHRRIHTGERPFRCDVCQKGFVGKGQLNKHRATHEAETENKQTYS